MSEDDAEEIEKTLKNNNEISIENYYFIDKNFENLDKICANIDKYDTICVCSFSEHSYLTSCLRRKISKKIYDIYDWFLEKNLVFYDEFYKLGEYIHDYYKEMYSLKQKYYLENNESLKQSYHKKIIETYLLIRDFEHMFRWIDDYYNAEYFDRENYILLKNKITDYLEKIKKIIMTKSKKDVIIEWIDALESRELWSMPFLLEKKNSGLWFSNSATVTPWTIATMWTMLMKIKAVDDHEFLFEKDKLNLNNSIVFNFLKKEGYNFYYVGGNASLIFQPKEIYRYFGRWSHTFSNNQWIMLQIMLESEKPCFFICHNIMETHYPNICPELKEDYVIYNKNKRIANPQIKTKSIYETSANYVDGQLKYYMDFCTNARKVYMSDHGKGEMFTRFRTVTILDSSDFKEKGECKELYSLYNFDKMVKYLILPTKNNFKNIFSDYLEIQDTDIYGWTYEMLAARPISIDHLLGYRAVCTKTAMYMKRNDGKKFLYIFPKKKNYIDDLRYSRIVNNLEKIIGDYQIDVEKYEYFKNCRLIRKAIECYYERIKNNKEEIEVSIKRCLGNIPKNAVIAIRGGGEHTDNLLKLIGDDLNIKYIIDQNLEQVVQKKDYIYLNVEYEKKIKFDYVILSSYGHRKDMALEFSDYESDRIIDIYEILKKDGIILNQPFYGAELIEPQDFEKAKYLMNNF